MIQATQPTRQPMYERPPTRFEHRTTSKSAPSGNRSPTELVRSWEAFDRLFEDAFAPVNYPADSQAQSQSQSQTQSRAQSQYPEENRSQYTADNRSQYTADYRTQYTGDDDNRSQYTADNRTQTQSAYQTATPRAPHPRSRNLYDQTPSQGGRTQLYEQAQSQTGQTYLYEETPTQMGRTELYNEDENETAPSQTGQTYLYEETPAKSFSELSDLFDDRASGMTAETTKPIPGAYPKSFPQQQQYHRQQQTPPRQQYADEKTPHIRHTGLPPTDEPLSSVEADQDFQRLWSEAEANRRKRMTRTVTRRRILQHGVMSPGGTVSTMQTEPEHKLRRKKSRFHLYRNGNADYMTATFDLPDVRKEDVHVAFQSSQLTITWESIITTERRADDRTIIRERKERKYARTLPLPAGTEFPDIKAYLENGVLTVMYPKFTATNTRAITN